MILERVSHCGDGKVFISWRADFGSVGSHLAHHIVDILELCKRRPPSVGLSPIEIGSEPYRKRLREIFVRMLLCIPAEYVSDKVVGEWIGAITLAVWPGV